MNKYGLIGYPLSHSFSPGYFAKKFEDLAISDADYGLYPLESIDEVEPLFDRLKGINVTIPYKEQVIPYLTELSEEAKEIGAVNTIKVKGGIVKGFNTDVYGFEKSLLPLLHKEVKSALVFGTGGAAKAVWYVLEKLGITFRKVSRTKGDILYSQLDNEIVADNHLLINTTPLGMSPNIESCPDMPYDAVSNSHILYDLVYNPSETLFLKNGKKAGSIIKNGYEMLELQADRSWEIWNE